MISLPPRSVGKSLFYGQNLVLYGEKHNLLPKLCNTGTLPSLSSFTHEVTHRNNTNHAVWTPFIDYPYISARHHGYNPV